MVLTSLKQQACNQNGQNQKIDFNKAKRLIDDIGVGMNKVKANKKDKKYFNDLNKLIIEITDNKVKK